MKYFFSWMKQKIFVTSLHLIFIFPCHNFVTYIQHEFKAQQMTKQPNRGSESKRKCTAFSSFYNKDFSFRVVLRMVLWHNILIVITTTRLVRRLWLTESMICVEILSKRLFIGFDFLGVAILLSMTIFESLVASICPVSAETPILG